MSFMWEEIMEQPEVLEQCLQYNEKTLSKLTAEIRKKGIDKILIAARGTSDHAAVYGKYVFELLTGLPVALAAPSVFSMYGRTLKLQNALVVGFSQSGRAEDVAEVIKAANVCGAVTVSITNDVASPLAGLAGYHLYCNSGPEKSVAATKTFTAELFLIGSLAIRLSEDTAVLEEYQQVPDLMRRTFEMSVNLDSVTERYRFMKECFVLARGVNYSVALETALKIQETSYVRAKAYATSDFHHGPMAMIEKDMPVLIFAPAGPSSRDVLELTHKVKEARADILMISDHDEYCGLGDVSLKIPHAPSDFTSPFCNAAAAQMFACRLSILKGLDPDSPRMLHKVTVTL